MTSTEAQRFLLAMDDELAANAEASGVTLAFSAAERETLHNVAVPNWSPGTDYTSAERVSEDVAAPRARRAAD